ncbi:cobalt ECF transporter T component CbiQ [Halanaerobaculum tunisiense]
MLDIDQYAYSNQLRAVHPGEKLLFSILTMVICLVMNSMFTSFFVILLMVGGIILGAKISSQIVIRLFMISSSFLFISIIPIIISISRENNQFLWYLNLWGINLGISNNNIIFTSHLILKSLATVSCLYFLSLTTPMVEIISILRKFKLPEILIELMILIYRLLFIFLESAEQIRVSQLSRLGYSSFKKSLFSVSQLFSNLFIEVYYRARKLQIALEARGYKGEIKVIDYDYKLSSRNLIAIILLEVILVIVAVLGGDLIV